jgi:hypothetical protein
MAKPNYSQQKKQREQAARKKRDEKLQRRQQKKDDGPVQPSQPADGHAGPAESAASLPAHAQ